MQICFYSSDNTGIFGNRLSFLVLFIYTHMYVVKRDQSKFAWVCLQGCDMGVGGCVGDRIRK